LTSCSILLSSLASTLPSLDPHLTYCNAPISLYPQSPAATEGSAPTSEISSQNPSLSPTTGLRVIYANIPRQRDLDLSIAALPEADLYVLAEILRTRQQLQVALTARGHAVVASSCSTDGKLRCAITAKYTLTVADALSHPAGACYVRHKNYRIIGVYVHHGLTTNQQINMAQWTINRVVANAPCVVVGDFNINSMRVAHKIVNARLLSKGLTEHINTRPTYFRGQTQSSIDRCYTTKCAAPVVSLQRIVECSDHIIAQIILSRNDLKGSPVAYWKMKIPSSGYRADEACTLQNLMQVMEADPGKAQTKHCRKMDRCRRLLREAHAARFRSVDQEQRTCANAHIRKYRHQLANAYYEEIMKTSLRPPKATFTPPSDVDPSALIEHSHEKFCKDEPLGRESTSESNVAITPELISEAIRCINKSSSTSDFSIAFLQKTSESCRRDIAQHMTRWIHDGIPDGTLVATLLLLLKDGKSSTCADSYRPISVVNVIGKLLQYCVYLLLEPLLMPIIQRHDHQFAYIRGNHIPRLFAVAQEHLDADRENALIVADLDGAFDSVHHLTMVDCIRNHLGNEWSVIVRNLLTAQTFRIALPGGYSPEMRMTRGLAQGNPLSCLLFNMLTSIPHPNIAGKTAMYADDSATRTTLATTQLALDFLQEWAEQRNLKWKPTKVHIVCRTPATFHFQGKTLNTVEEARYLGAHLHAGNVRGICQRHWRMAEAAETKVLAIASIITLPTFLKARMYSTYVLSSFSHHALSKCCAPADVRMRDARIKLLPKFVLPGFSDFNKWEHGYAMPTFETYVHAQRTRMLPFIPSAARHVQWMIPPQIRVVPLHPELAPNLDELVKCISAVSKQRVTIRCASDASFHPKTRQGAIGICIEQAAFGYALEQPLTSSTAVEQVGQMVLQRAISLSGVKPERFENYCDNKAVTRQPHNWRSAMNPRSLFVGKPSLADSADIIWDRGHASNVWINRADEVASGAVTTLDTKHIFAVMPHVLSTLEYDLQYGQGTTARPVATFQQSQEAAHFYRHMCRMKLEPLRLRIRTLVPLGIALSKTLRKRLLRLRGAHDLWLAILSHSILPNRTARKTKVLCPTCKATPLTAKHVLFCNDEQHIKVVQQRFPDSTFPATKEHFWDMLQKNTDKAMKHIAKIVLMYAAEDRTANMLASLVLVGKARTVD